MILLDYNILEQKKNTLDKKVFKKLQKKADEALYAKNETILDFPGFPKDKKDYYSLAAYYHKSPDGKYIKHDGIYNQESRNGPKDVMSRLTDDVLILALAGYFIDKKYSARAAERLSAWFLSPNGMNPNLIYAQAIPGNDIGRPAGIIDAHHWINIITAIDLIELVITDNKFLTEMKEWFGKFADWLHTSDNANNVREIGNNINAWRNTATLVFALFAGNRDKIVNKCYDEFKDILESKTDEQGCFVSELDRTRSLHYNLFFLDAMAVAAEAAYNQGIDLWHYFSPTKKNIENSFDFLGQFLMGKPWPYPQMTEEFKKRNSFYIAAVRLNRPDFIDINQGLVDNTWHAHLGPAWLWHGEH